MRDDNPQTQRIPVAQEDAPRPGPGSPDDIDLFATLEVIWSKKWTAIALAIAITGAGLTYAELKLLWNPQYTVSAPYELTSTLYWGQEHCTKTVNDGQFLACSHRVALALERPWQLDFGGQAVSLITGAPGPASAYEEQLNNSALQATKAAYTVANNDIALVKTIDDTPVADTETMAETTLAANRLINLLNSTGTLVTYGSVSIEPLEPPTLRRARLGALGLGPVIGILWVLFFNAFQTRYPKYRRGN